MNLDYTIAPSAGSNTVCYLLLPMDVGTLNALAKEYGVNLVSVIVNDWDNDLTPWPAKGVMPGDADFKGDAMQTLEYLRKELMPQVENVLNLSRPERWLLGISLSGLFAVWAWMQGNDFHKIASLSGSFWYDDFPQWLAEHGRNKDGGFAYLSLGDEESRTHIKRFQPVEECTTEVINILRMEGALVQFESVPGSHYAPMLPRIHRALASLSTLP